MRKPNFLCYSVLHAGEFIGEQKRKARYMCIIVSGSFCLMCVFTLSWVSFCVGISFSLKLCELHEIILFMFLPFLLFPNLDIEVYSCFLIGAIFGFTLARWCHGFQQPLLPFPVCLLEKWVTFRKEWGQNCLPRLQKAIGWRTVCTLKLFCETYLSPRLGFPTSWRESGPVMGWRERLQTYCIH